MKNIVLIGMPGTGKSVVGHALAQRLNYTFVDLDESIVEATGKTLPEILREDGLEEFFKIEEKVGVELNRTDTVVSTGGSMVLYEDAMAHLRENGIAAPAGMTLRQIYEQREPLYAKYADLIVVSRDGADGTAREVLQMLRTVGIEL